MVQKKVRMLSGTKVVNMAPLEMRPVKVLLIERARRLNVNGIRIFSDVAKVESFLPCAKGKVRLCKET